MTDLIPRDAVLRAIMYGDTFASTVRKINAIPAAQVAVKPLEWDDGGSAEAPQRARGIGGMYWIDRQKEFLGSPEIYRLSGPCSGQFPTMEAAKAAAQNDYHGVSVRPSTPIDPAQIRADALRDGNWGDLIQEAMTEAEKAMRKYPQPNYVITKIAEEAGEVVKAAVHAAEGRETLENLRGEMIQLIAMLFRLWVEGDQVHGLLPVALRVDASPSPETAANAATSQRGDDK